MHGIVSYEIGTGRAFDEDGNDIRLEFCLADTTKQTEAGFVTIGGELHVCRDFGLFSNLLSFWVRPAPSWATLRNVVSVEPSPVATYQTVVDVFNRLAKLQSEGHHDGQTFYLPEVVWGLLTSMGVVVDFSHVETELYGFGSMLDGSFNPWNAEALAFWLETAAQRLGGEV